MGDSHQPAPASSVGSVGSRLRYKPRTRAKSKLKARAAASPEREAEREADTATAHAKLEIARRNHDRDPEPDPDGGDGRRVVGRLRKYLSEDNGRYFDVDDPRTPEHRLVDPDSPSWHVPIVDEDPPRRKSGTRVSDIQLSDIGRYKASDFRTRRTDERGHDKPLNLLGMPPQMLNELTAIVDSKVFPVRSVKGLALTYIYEMLLITHELARQDGLVIANSHMPQLEALARMNRNAQSVLGYEEMLVESCRLVRDLMRCGVRNKARTMVYEMLEVVKKIQSGELRRRWQHDIEAEFRDVMRGRPARVHVKEVKPPINDDDDADE